MSEADEWAVMANLDSRLRKQAGRQKESEDWQDYQAEGADPKSVINREKHKAESELRGRMANYRLICNVSVALLVIGIACAALLYKYYWTGVFNSNGLCILEIGCGLGLVFGSLAGVWALFGKPSMRAPTRSAVLAQKQIRARNRAK